MPEQYNTEHHWNNVAGSRTGLPIKWEVAEFLFVSIWPYLLSRHIMTLRHQTISASTMSSTRNASDNIYLCKFTREVFYAYYKNKFSVDTIEINQVLCTKIACCRWKEKTLNEERITKTEKIENLWLEATSNFEFWLENINFLIFMVSLTSQELGFTWALLCIYFIKTISSRIEVKNLLNTDSSR